LFLRDGLACLPSAHGAELGVHRAEPDVQESRNTHIARQLHVKFAPNSFSESEVDLSQMSPESQHKLLEEMNGWRAENTLSSNIEVREE
jgi:hypothetical protein